MWQHRPVTVRHRPARDLQSGARCSVAHERYAVLPTGTDGIRRDCHRANLQAMDQAAVRDQSTILRREQLIDIVDVIAQRLRQARRERGWNQEEASRHLKISPKTYQRYENAEFPIRVDRLAQVAEDHGKSIFWFLTPPVGAK